MSVVSTSAVAARRRAAHALLALLALSAMAPGVEAFYSWYATIRLRVKLLNLVRELWMDGSVRMMRIEFIKKELNKDDDFAMGQELLKIVAMKNTMVELYKMSAAPDSPLNVFQVIQGMVKTCRMQRHLENYVQAIIEDQLIDPAGVRGRDRRRRRGGRRSAGSLQTLQERYEKQNNVSLDKLFNNEYSTLVMYDSLTAAIEERKL